MTDTSKMGEQLATSKLGKQASLYMTAVDCVKQTSTRPQAAKLLAKKFMDKNPWAAELIGLSIIEKQAMAYVQRRYHEMRDGAGPVGVATGGHGSIASPTAQPSKWSRSDIPATPDRGGAGHTMTASGHASGASAASDTSRNQDKPPFSPSAMAKAQSAIKGAAADSILQTLKFSDGVLVGALPLRTLRCYENDGTLAKTLLDKIRSKFRNPDTKKTIMEYLNENEIRICAETAKDIKLAEARS